MIVTLATNRIKKPAYVNSLQEASNLCSKFIEAGELTSEQWQGGEVFTDEGKQIANISYNGRIWDLNGKEIPAILALAPIGNKSI